MKTSSVEGMNNASAEDSLVLHLIIFEEREWLLHCKETEIEGNPHLTGLERFVLLIGGVGGKSLAI